MNLSDLLLAAGIAWLVGRLAACSMIPGPSAPSAAAQGTERLSYPAVSGNVDALRAGRSNAPRLIYVHGSPGDASGWLDYLVHPVPGSESIAIDRPGYGRTAPRATVPSLAAQAQAIEPLLVQRGGRWPVLVGHSLGGPIVLQAAVDYPERVAGVVVIAGSVDLALERLRWYNYLAKGLAWILPRGLRRSNEEMWGLKAELQSLESRLDRVRCPVWILHGSNDSLVPVDNVKLLQSAIADTHTTVLEGAGHFLIWQDAWQPTVRAVLRMAFADQR